MKCGTVLLASSESLPAAAPATNLLLHFGTNAVANVVHVGADMTTFPGMRSCILSKVRVAAAANHCIMVLINMAAVVVLPPTIMRICKTAGLGFLFFFVVQRVLLVLFLVFVLSLALTH